MKKQTETTKAVTTRFTMKDFLLLEEEAEMQGGTKADVIRRSWANMQEQKQTINLLKRLEQRQRQSTFEMLSILLNLNPEERAHALEQLSKKGIKW